MEKTYNLGTEIRTAADLPGLVSFVNSHNKWSFINGSWTDFVEEKELKSLDDKYFFIHPSDADNYRKVLNNSFKNKSPYTIDVRFRKKNGEYIYVRECGSPSFNVTNEVLGFTCVATDVNDLYNIHSEKNKLENLLEALVDFSWDMIAVYDKDFKLVKMNSKVAEITGMNSSEMIGKTYLEIYPQAASSKGHSDLMSAMEGNNIHNDRYVSTITNRTYENFLFPLKDDDQKIYGVLAIAHDFTDYINTAGELEKAYRILEDKNKELERSNKELGSFTYIASHDLQEPLRKIQAFGKRIVEKEAMNLTDNGKDYLTRMVDAAQRMQNLIDSLLEFSRTATASKQFEESDLNILIEEVKKEIRFSIEEKQAVIEIMPLPTLSVIPFQFKQLVSNLISNSLKYSKVTETPQIKIESDIIAGKLLEKYQAEPGINYCRLSFSDNGIGFDPIYSNQIFELFQRLHGRAEYSGSGIGLSICKKIAENHGGFMTAEGRPNVGATFSLYLPVKH